MGGQRSTFRRIDDAVLGEGATYRGRTGFRGMKSTTAVVFPLLVLAGLAAVFAARLGNVWYGFAFAAGCLALLAADRAVRGLWSWQRSTRR